MPVFHDGLPGLTARPRLRILPVNRAELRRQPVTVSTEATPPAGPPRLDAGALARLRELDPDGRHGVVTRVLTAFETSLARMTGQLEAERGAAGNPVAVANVAHTLKSSAASVGALELSRVCSEVERRLRDGQPGDLDADIARLLAAAEPARQAVAAMLRP